MVCASTRWRRCSTSITRARHGEWIPNQYGGRENLEAVEFLQQLNTVTHGRVPGTITVAEESTAWPAVSRPTYVGGLGFTFKWNMGWMHDMLEYIQQDPVHRRWHHNQITFSMLYAFTENFVLPFSHDEVVHGKRRDARQDAGRPLAEARDAARALRLHVRAPGQEADVHGLEFGQWREWNHDESLDWHLLDDPMHEGLRRWVRDLNRTYQRERSLHEVDFEGQGFGWIDCNDNENSVISLIRRARDPHDFTVMVVNFTPVPRPHYRIGVPEGGWYREVLNSDAASTAAATWATAAASTPNPIPRTAITVAQPRRPAARVCAAQESRQFTVHSSLHLTLQ